MRLVLEHTQGPYKGLLQIVGYLGQLLQEGESLKDLPTLQPFNRGAEQIAASLVAVKRTYILYRELMVPVGASDKTFNPLQQ